jgi:hypothetical protein
MVAYIIIPIAGIGDFMMDQNLSACRRIGHGQTRQLGFCQRDLVVSGAGPFPTQLDGIVVRGRALWHLLASQLAQLVFADLG